MSNKYTGLSKQKLEAKLKRTKSTEKAVLYREALAALEAEVAPAPAVEAVVEEAPATETVVEEAPAPEPVVEAAPVVEEAAPEAKPKKRTYRRKKSTTTKE